MGWFKDNGCICATYCPPNSYYLLVGVHETSVGGHNAYFYGYLHPLAEHPQRIGHEIPQDVGVESLPYRV